MKKFTYTDELAQSEGKCHPQTHIVFLTVHKDHTNGARGPEQGVMSILGAKMNLCPCSSCSHQCARD